jgi:hypothetical protein
MTCLRCFIFSHATSDCYCYYKLLIKAYATDIENARNNIIDVNIYPVNIAIKHPPIKANHIKSSIIQPPVVIYLLLLNAFLRHLHLKIIATHHQYYRILNYKISNAPQV